MCWPVCVSTFTILEEPPRHFGFVAGSVAAIASTRSPEAIFSSTRLPCQWWASSEDGLVSMSTLIRIADLTLDNVRAFVRTALRRGLDQSSLLDYLASIDWGGSPGDPAVRDLLGQIELWATEYDEGDLSLGQYMARLVSILPREERSLRLFLGGAGQMQVTIDPAVAQESSPEEEAREVSVSPRMRLVAQV